MGTLPDFRTFPPDDLLGLFTCQREYLQGYKTSKIASVAICGRSCHIMPVLSGELAFVEVRSVSCSVHVCMNTIDYNVLTGIAVIAAARYFARARESFRDD